MAAAIKLLATQMEAMEASFLSVFFEAANKIANLTDSKLFFLMESSDGVRKVGGHKELKLAYELGQLSPRNNDIEIDGKAFEESTPSLESYPDSNNRKRKMNHPLDKQTGSKIKYCREDEKCQETSVVKMEGEKEEEGEEEVDEEDDVGASPIDLDFSDDEHDKSRGSTDKTEGNWQKFGHFRSAQRPLLFG